MNEEFKRLKQQAFMMTELEDLDYDLILERFGQLIVKEVESYIEEAEGDIDLVQFLIDRSLK